MMSAGVRALCTNVMSLVEARSVAVRTIDISGVIPLPAERKRYLFAGCRAVLNRPFGPVTHSRVPGRTWSCSQFETGPPGTRLTVMLSESGRVGADAIV